MNKKSLIINNIYISLLGEYLVEYISKISKMFM